MNVDENKILLFKNSVSSMKSLLSVWDLELPLYK